MKSNKTILLIFLFTCCSNIFSQTDTAGRDFESGHILSLSSGLAFNSVRDEIISPLIYRGTKIPFEFSYRYKGKESRQTLLLNYNKGDLTSSISNLSSGVHYVKNLNLSLEYSYALKVCEINKPNSGLFIGSKFSSMLNMRNHYFTKSNSHESAEHMTGLGIYFLAETSLEKESCNILSLEVNIPFLSYALLTNQYNANVGEDLDELDPEKNIIWQVFKKGRLISFNKLIEAEADLKYNLFVTDYLGITFNYRFQYYSISKFQSVSKAKVLNNSFLIGMTVKL